MARPSNTDVRQAQIIDALQLVMAETGYAEASVVRIAETAGLAPGLVHYHFGSKLEVLLALVDRLTSAAEARIEARLVPVCGDGRGQIAAFIDGLLATGDGADPAAVACWTVIGSEALREPDVQAAYQGFLNQAVRRLRGLLIEALKEEGRRRSGVGAMAAGIMATIEGYFRLAATAPGLVPAGSAAATTRRMAFGLLDAQATVDTQGADA